LTAAPSAHDAADALTAAVSEAAGTGAALHIRGSGSKDFLGRQACGTPLDVSSHRGVLSYEPSELVLTARGGTLLTEIQALLTEHGQMLAFEPPAFGPGATLAGTVASGLSGPRRPYAGSARDFVLGVRVLNGRGQVCRFGGEVMKNVAGYDLSRLMAGAMGTLGVLLDISLKVLPKPVSNVTQTYEMKALDAIDRVSNLGGKPLPLSAATWLGGRLYVRYSGSETGVAAAVRDTGGETLDPEQATRFWDDLREHRLEFFAGDEPLWRISVPPASPPLRLSGPELLDWGGAQRWLRTGDSMETVREAAAVAGGHATLFRGGDRSGPVFHPLTPGMGALHRRVKASLDPAGIFNPGRLYEGL
jgi:glycolate oxidase FAD binding subunit